MSVPTEIERHCDDVHRTSYVYRKLCYEQQMAAKDKRNYERFE